MDVISLKISQICAALVAVWANFQVQMSRDEQKSCFKELLTFSCWPWPGSPLSQATTIIAPESPSRASWTFCPVFWLPEQFWGANRRFYYFYYTECLKFEAIKFSLIGTIETMNPGSVETRQLNQIKLNICSKEIDFYSWSKSSKSWRRFDWYLNVTNVMLWHNRVIWDDILRWQRTMGDIPEECWLTQSYLSWDHTTLVDNAQWAATHSQHRGVKSMGRPVTWPLVSV